MAQRIRRNSMEHLELYDLDKLTSNHQLPPPLPPPRIPLTPNFAFERYQFLCDMTRHKTDPIYAQTPMFRTIPQSEHGKYRRQIFGTRFPSKIITPRLTTSPKSEEPESAGIDNGAEEEEEDEENADEDDNQDSDNDDDDDNDNNDDDDDDSGSDESSSSSSSKSNSDSSSSSSSSSDHNDNFDDDGDNRGIVEKIFNRHKK